MFYLTLGQKQGDALLVPRHCANRKPWGLLLRGQQHCGAYRSSNFSLYLSDLRQGFAPLA